MDSTPIYLDGKIVGLVIGATFVKRLAKSRHFLRIPPAIAFDISTLEAAENAGASNVCIEEIEEGHRYYATILQIRTKGFELNRGHGDQIALALKFWSPKNMPRQLLLFGGTEK